MPNKILAPEKINISLLRKFSKETDGCISTHMQYILKKKENFKFKTLSFLPTSLVKNPYGFPRKNVSGMTNIVTTQKFQGNKGHIEIVFISSQDNLYTNLFQDKTEKGINYHDNQGHSEH